MTTAATTPFFGALRPDLSIVYQSKTAVISSEDRWWVLLEKWWPNFHQDLFKNVRCNFLCRHVAPLSFEATMTPLERESRVHDLERKTTLRGRSQENVGGWGPSVGEDFKTQRGESLKALIVSQTPCA